MQNVLSVILEHILALLAIVLSIYFYFKSKDTEQHIAVSLKGIETQTNTLQHLTGEQQTLSFKLMSQLVTTATSTHPTQQMFQFLRDVMPTSPTTSAIQVPEPPEQQPPHTNRSIMILIELYRYALMSNFLIQNTTRFTDEVVKNISGDSNRVMDAAERELSQVDSGILEAHDGYDVYQKLRDSRRSVAKTSDSPP